MCIMGSFRASSESPVIHKVGSLCTFDVIVAIDTFIHNTIMYVHMY